MPSPNRTAPAPQPMPKVREGRDPASGRAIHREILGTHTRVMIQLKTNMPRSENVAQVCSHDHFSHQGHGKNKSSLQQACYQHEKKAYQQTHVGLLNLKTTLACGKICGTSRDNRPADNSIPARPIFRKPIRWRQVATSIELKDFLAEWQGRMTPSFVTASPPATTCKLHRSFQTGAAGERGGQARVESITRAGGVNRRHLYRREMGGR